MPFARPTLSDLRTQVASDINAALPGVDALLRYSNLGIIGDVLAALASGNFGYLDWIARQSVPFTATDEYLEGWAALKGVTRKPAAIAMGAASFPAANGATVPAGTTINRTDGVSYMTVADAVGANGSVVAQIQAVTAGSDGNADVGTAVLLLAGISGVTAAGSISTIVTGGADIEVDADLRSRMLQTFASPPQGGSITDYPAYALAVPGVTRAWVTPAAQGPGTLGIYFMMDVAQAAHGGFPQGSNGVSQYEPRAPSAQGDQLTVADAIFPRQSVTAMVFAVAPIPNSLTITIAGLSTASAVTQQAISNAIAAVLLLGAAPGGITFLSAIEAAISAVPSTGGFIVTNIAVTAGSVGNGGGSNGAVGNITSNEGALPVLGGVVYA